MAIRLDGLFSHLNKRRWPAGVLLAVALLFASAGDAQALPSVKIGTADLISPGAANTFYGSGTTASTGLGAPTARPPELVELARALRNDPDLIYEYVRNNVEVEWMYGLQKGALGAAIDRSGTAFDQAMLMVELLRQSGYTASYKAGTIKLNGTQFQAWTGITSAKAACQLLANGGIPGAVNGSTTADCNYGSDTVSTIQIAHVWVSVTIGGTAYVFDPSYKTYTWKTGLNLGTATGMSPGAALSAATHDMTSDTVSGVGYVRSLDATGLATALSGYASSLLAYIESNAPGAEMEDITGGGIVILYKTPSGGLRQTAHPFADPSPPYATIGWSGNIPDQYRTVFKLTDVLNYGLTPPTIFNHLTFYADEIYGRRLSIGMNYNLDQITVPTDYDHTRVSLQLDGIELASYTTGTVTAPAVDHGLTLEIFHPYAAASGHYMDTAIDQKAEGLTPFSILLGFGETGPELLAKWSNERTQDTAGPLKVSDWSTCENCVPTIPSPEGDFTRDKMAASYLAQFSRATRMHANIAGAVPQLHHILGVVYADDGLHQEEPDPVTHIKHVDWTINDSYTRLDLETGFSLTSKTASATARRAGLQGIAATAAMLEGSVPGQMADLVDTSSTATRFDWGNAPPSGEDPTGSGARKFLAFDSTNASSASTLIKADVTPVTGSTPPGGTASTAASAVADYAAAGFSVIASQEAFLGPGQRGGAYYRDPLNADNWLYDPAKQRGGAFVATKYDANGDPTEIAHVLTSGLEFGSKGGGGALTQATTATYGPPEPADTLKSRFVDRSGMFGVNLSNGALSYTAPASLRVGSGGFPYELDYTLTWRAGIPTPTQFGPTAPAPPVGWFDNWTNTLNVSSSGMEALGSSDPRAAAAAIAAFYAMQDVYGASAATAQDLAAREATGVLVASWFARQVVHNTVSVTLGAQTEQFVRLADGRFITPGAGAVQTLVQTGTIAAYGYHCSMDLDFKYALSRGWDYSGLGFTVTGAAGDVKHFGYVPEDHYLSLGKYCAKAPGYFVQNDWTFPSGVKVTFNRPSRTMTTQTGSTYTLAANGDGSHSISNNLGRKINLAPAGNVFANNALSGGDARAVTFTLDGSGVASITDPASATTHFAYTTAITAASTTQRPVPYSQLYQVFTADDAVHPNLQYDYDALGRVKDIRDAINLQIGDHTVFGGRDPWQFYIADGRRGMRGDPLGNLYSVVYDTKGRAARYLDELGRETDADYDGRGRLLGYTYPEGDREVYAYDARNNKLSLTRKAKPGSGLSDIVVSQTFVEGASVVSCSNPVTCNKPATQTSARGNVTDLSWDSTYGLLTQVLLPADSHSHRPQTDYAYTSYGSPSFKLLTTKTEKIDATHNLVTALTYDSSNHYLPLTTVVDSGSGHLNLTTTLAFDAQGNVTQADGPRTDVSDVSDFTYDLDNRQIYAIQADPDGAGSHPRPTTKNTYDAIGRITQVDTGTSTSSTGGSFSSALTVTTAYDPAGEKIRVTTPTSVTQLSYDGAGRQLCTAARMNPSVFASLPADACVPGLMGAYGPDRVVKTIYDAAGQALQQLRGVGSGSAITYATNTYTLNGKLASVYDANGATHITTYTYDGFDRLAITTFADATHDDLTYLASGALCSSNDQPCTRTNRSGQVFTFTYDNLDRVLTKVVPTAGSVAGRTVTSDYDLLGRPLTVSDDVGNTLTNTYDLPGRLLTAARTTSLLSAKTVSYQYDDASNRTRLTWPDGYYVDYAYDALNHPLTAIDSGSTTLATYTYDGQGRRTGLQYNGTTGASMAWSWSAENDLTTLSSDFSGTTNDVSFTNTFTPAHQWASGTLDNTAYQFAPGAASSTTAYTSNTINAYDTQNGHTQYNDTRGNFLGAVAAALYTYDAENHFVAQPGVSLTNAYDPNGRRTSKAVSGTTTNFVHDGDGEIADYDGSGNLTRRFVPGPAIDEYIAMVTAGGTKTFFHTDKLGSVIAMSDMSGALVEGPYAYDSYGACYIGGASCTTQAATTVPFRFTGQREDFENGYYYYRARFYAPSRGRFIQTDPVGYKDDLNMYTYVGNDPTDMTDPTGKNGWQVTVGVLETVAGGGGAIFGGFLVGGGVVVTGGTLGLATPLTGPEIIGAAGLTLASGSLALKGISDIQQGWSQNNEAPPLPTGPVGTPPHTEGKGGQIQSGPLHPDHGGTGDANADHDHLTGGTAKPNEAGGRPPGTKVGDNGIQIRPGKSGQGPRIDIPPNGSKPAETLHYPPPPKP